MRVLKVLDDLLLAEGGLVLVDGERSSGSLGLGLRGGLRRGRLLLLQFLLCGELCGLVGFGLFLLLCGGKMAISLQVAQIESTSRLTILLRGGRIRCDGGGGVFSRHGGTRSSDKGSRRRREGEGRGGSEEKMPSSAEQAARRNQHPGVVEGSMAGGGRREAAMGSSAARPHEFSGRREGSHHESTDNSWRTGPNAIKLGLSTDSNSIKGPRGNAPDTNVTHWLSLHGLVPAFYDFPTSGARTRLGSQAPKILKLKALFSRGVPTEGSRGEALLETRRVGSTQIPQSFKPKVPTETVSGCPY